MVIKTKYWVFLLRKSLNLQQLSNSSFSIFIKKNKQVLISINFKAKYDKQSQAVSPAALDDSKRHISHLLQTLCRR